MRSAKLLLYVSMVPLLSIAILTSSCSTRIPATITRRSPIALMADPRILLITNRQPQRITESLEMAGLRVFSKGRADYTLVVVVGNNRSGSGCGTVRNVAYTLSSNGMRELVTIKGRGATGRCEPNIFDDMSRKLVAQMGGS